MAHNIRESYWSTSTTDNRQSEIYGPFDATRDRRYVRSLSIYPEDESNPEIDTIPIAPPAAPAVPDKDHPYYRPEYQSSDYRSEYQSDYRPTYRPTYRSGGTNQTSPNRVWQIPQEATIAPLDLKKPVTVDHLRWSRVSDEPADEGMSGLHEFFFVTTVCMAQLCTQAGLGQTLAIIHVIGFTWGITNPSELSWLIAGYTLTIGTFILVAGRLGDVYGYKRVFLSGFLWSALWACLAGAAYYSGPALFTVCRVLQGMGAAMCLPNAIALLGAAYNPGRKKSLVFSAFAAMAPCGSIIGAAGGSAFALVWWPVAYWAFSFTLCIVAIIGYYAIPPAKTGKETPQTFRAWLMELDIPGATAGVSALVLINFAFNQGHISGWNEPCIWEALIVGGILMCIFIMIECHYARNPILPLNALSPQVSLILGAVACGWACFGIWSFYTWQFLQVIRKLSPLLTTGWMSPIAVMGIFASMTTGMVLHKLGPPVAMLISMLAFTAATVLIATAPEDQTYWSQTFVGMLVISWGMDMSFPAATLLLSNSVSKKHQGIAASLVATVINYSMSIGIGIGGTVEAQVTKGAVTKERVLSGYRAALLTGVGLAGTGAIICIALIVATKLPAVIEVHKTKRREAAMVKREKEMATPCYSCRSCRNGGSTTVGSHAGSSVA
ncbi:MFS general substrate transporter [Apiospora arundinis]